MMATKKDAHLLITNSTLLLALRGDGNKSMLIGTFITVSFSCQRQKMT